MDFTRLYCDDICPTDLILSVLYLQTNKELDSLRVELKSEKNQNSSLTKQKEQLETSKHQVLFSWFFYALQRCGVL